jgi:hypothetical protein
MLHKLHCAFREDRSFHHLNVVRHQSHLGLCELRGNLGNGLGYL